MYTRKNVVTKMCEFTGGINMEECYRITVRIAKAFEDNELIGCWYYADDGLLIKNGDTLDGCLALDYIKGRVVDDIVELSILEEDNFFEVKFPKKYLISAMMIICSNEPKGVIELLIEEKLPRQDRMYWRIKEAMDYIKQYREIDYF